MFAVITFGMAVLSGTPAAILAVLVGLAALAVTLTGRGSTRIPSGNHRQSRLLLLGVISFGLIGVIAIPGLTFGPSSPWLDRFPGVIWASIGLAALAGENRDRDLRHPLVVIALAATAVFGVLHIQAVRDIGLDVLVLHKQAAAAIADGLSPYSGAVTVPNGAPYAGPDDFIVGYPYPPVTAIGFSLGEWVAGDARYTGLVSWLAFLAMLGISGLRNRQPHQIYVMLLLAALPGWPLVLRAAWTEPFSLALLAAMFFTWGSQRMSGGFLGLGLASKQYFAVTAPVLALMRGSPKWTRKIAALIAIAAVQAVGFIWGPQVFWSAAVEFHLSTPPRPESSNLVGLASLLGGSWSAPTAVTFGAGLLVAVVTGLRAKTRQDVVLALAATLGVSFFLSSQAFANYWFLVMGLVALAMAEADDKRA